MKKIKEYRKLSDNIKFIHIKKDNKTIYIVNKKYKNKKLECSVRQNSNCI